MWSTLFIISPYQLSCNHWVATRDGLTWHLVLHENQSHQHGTPILSHTKLMLDIVIDRVLSLWTCGHCVRSSRIPIAYRFMAKSLYIDYTKVLDNISIANMLNKQVYDLQRVSNNFTFDLHGNHNFLVFFRCINTHSCCVIYANSHICPCHNIIHIHNNVQWDWHYYVKRKFIFILNVGIFCIILSVPHSIVMDLYNVMVATYLPRK